MNTEKFVCPQTGLVRDFARERDAENRRAEAIRWASDAHRRHEISRLCDRLELEGDEFGTAEQKATSMVRSRAH